MGNTHGKNEKYLQNFGRKIWRKEITWENYGYMDESSGGLLRARQKHDSVQFLLLIRITWGRQKKKTGKWIVSTFFYH
jgi:hypothetical protein